MMINDVLKKYTIPGWILTIIWSSSSNLLCELVYYKSLSCVFVIWITFSMHLSFLFFCHHIVMLIFFKSSRAYSFHLCLGFFLCLSSESFHFVTFLIIAVDYLLCMCPYYPIIAYGPIPNINTVNNLKTKDTFIFVWVTVTDLRT